ncbi:MAG: M23 family metallopeptidase [Spirochaetaceae bacterium]|nr:M23 family metallopeptidase [Spirochaetaceae bacterium]RKX75163.1 MAG: M23 family peptidase [Spirochaetota bacterium]
MQLQRFTIRYYLLISVFIILTATLIYSPLRVSADVSQLSSDSLKTAVFTELGTNLIDLGSDTYTDSSLSLARGQSLSDLLQDTGISSLEAFDITDSLGGIIDMRRIQEGQIVTLRQTSGGRIQEVSLPVSFDRTVTARRTSQGWQSSEQLTDIYPVPTVVTARVESSLFQAAEDSGIPLSIMMEAIGLFSFEVDFQRDIQPGNIVVLLYEKLQNKEGETMAAGELLYAGMELDDRNVEAWRYERLDGTVEYYEESGDSVRKALLKTPVDGARISSGFGFRNIPALGFSGLHRGIDFAVRIGTPVMVAGDGEVIIAGWHKLYGYRVMVRHVNHYDTMYAHFSRIAPGIRPGVQVEQGQIIGYSGNTGNSTGPHCHYEVHYYGEPVNPSALKFPPGHKLESEDMNLFTLERRALIAEFNLP